MSCDPSVILTTSSFRGLTVEQLSTIQDALLRNYARPTSSAQEIMTDSGGLDGYTDEQKSTMQTQLMCRIKEVSITP